MASVEELCDHIALINNSRKILDGEVKSIKENYSNNTFEVRFNLTDQDIRAILPGTFDVLKNDVDNDLRVAHIRLPEGTIPNDLLALLMPHVTIHSLNEIIPSMNDIFIQVVTQKEVAE